MNSFSDIPDNLIEQAEMMENILIACATGDCNEDQTYVCLRRQFMGDSLIKPLLPSFVRSNKNLSMFWGFIKLKYGSYGERREFIHEGFKSLIDYLSGNTLGDDVTSDTLKAFDIAGINKTWTRALERRKQDPKGAITLARTLLETVIKHILDKSGQEYSEREDLPKLYNKVAKQLNLAPTRHSEESVKAILGSITNLVNGIGTLRNQLSDAHGSGEKIEGSEQAVEPSIRHANLAVNTAGALATFLVQTYQEHHDRQNHER